MGLFGPSAQELQQRAVNKARGYQKETSRMFSKQEKKLRKELSSTQDQLGSLTGMNPKQATQSFAENFYKTIADIGKTYSTQLSQYDPNILGSTSAQRFAGEIGRAHV